ncbi:MAG: hypothetical protein OEN56_15530, partial [Gemmatimonadota bacterium]|nr:hypothetical protein [Gemmatimonadota bacterium]
MTMLSNRRRTTLGLSILFAAALGGCDVAPDPVGIEDEPILVLGRVADVTGPASPAALHGGASSAVGGITVAAEGGTSDVTDDAGNFAVEVASKDGRVRLRFRGTGIDARIEISGLPAGSVLQISVHLDDDAVVVVSSSDSRDNEFEGMASLVAVDGDAPARTARVAVASEGGTEHVDIVEGGTVFDNEGDILSFGDMLAALDRADLAVKIEGEGTRQDDGSVLASAVKVETDDDGHDDDVDDDDGDQDEGPDEFEGMASLVAVDGEAGARTARVELVSEGGVEHVDIVEGGTVFDNEGDILSFGDMLAALDRADLAVKIEGEGDRQDDGSVLASAVKVETDDDAPGDDGDPNEGPEEFEGMASLVA